MGLSRESIWYNLYNMYDTCGKHLLPKAKLYDDETTRAISHTGVVQQILHLSPLVSTSSCARRPCTVTTPSRAAPS